jgi:hypothetical protein
MRKVAYAQRPLFGPWLAWRELPDSVREQALDVLTTLFVEIIEVSHFGERTGQNPSGAETTPTQPFPQRGATSR